MSWGSAIFEIRQQPTYSGSGQICVIFLTMFGYLSCRHYEMTSHTRSVQVSMWPDICNIFSHFHCWLVVPPPSWSSGALYTVLLSSCALCHPPPGPLAGGIPERKTWQTTLSQLFPSSELFAHFVNVISVEDGSHPVLKNKICPYRGYRSSSYSKYNFRLPKKTEKQLFFQHLTLGCPKQTNKTNNFVFNIWNHRLCALMGERTSSLGEGRRDLLMDSWWTGICHIYYR